VTSFAEVRDASRNAMPVGMKKSWNAAMPTTKFVGDAIVRPSIPIRAPAPELPAARPTPLTRLTRL
jgi:hypothetical protein